MPAALIRRNTRLTSPGRPIMKFSMGKYDELLPGSSRSRRPKDGGLFVWTIIIVLLIGVAIVAWVGSLHVFGHPETPLGYSVLTRMKKLDPPKRFELTAAPRGQFLSPDKLMEKYGAMTPRELSRESARMTREFIRNYKLNSELVTYVIGDYRILDSFELMPQNYFPSGVVVIAEAKDNPKALLEHVFTADAKVIPILHRTLLTGLDLQLHRNLDLSALVNVRRLADGRMQFTAIPIVYGNYASTGGPGSFSLEPPKSLNVGAGLPVVKPDAVDESTQRLAAFRRRTGQGGASGADVPTPAFPVHEPPQLVRVERPEPLHEEMAAPTPTPVPPPIAVAAPTPVLAETTPPTEPTPAPSLSPSPPPSPTPTPPSTIASTTGGAWPVYDPGQMPRGRLISPQDVGEQLSQGGVGSERMYLQGSFVVTASGPNRAALRTQAAVAESLGFKGKASNIRIIVEYPTGTRPPSEGSTFSRDSRRPFHITDIRESPDGQINVWVREVTR